MFVTRCSPVVAVAFLAAFCAAPGPAGSAPLPPDTNPADHAGKTVTIEAVNTRLVSAHVMEPPLDRQAVNYLDFGRRQIVAYSREPLPCDGRVRLTGHFFEVRGRGGPRTKSGGYRAWHFVVDEHWCL